MFVGLSLTSAAMFHLTGFNAQVSFHHLAIARVYQCIGLPLFFVPLNTIAYSDLPKGKSNNASALMNLMRNLGGSVGISVAITLLERRTQFHLNRLVSHTTIFDHAFRRSVGNLTAVFIKAGSGPTAGHTQALMLLNRTVEQQAEMNSYLDIFKVMAVGSLAVLVLVIFLKKIHHGVKAPDGAH